MKATKADALYGPRDNGYEAGKGSYPGEDPQGADTSDSLILTEQAKALPEGFAANDEAAEEKGRNEQVREITGRSITELLQLTTEAETTGAQFLQQHVNPGRERSYKAFRNEHFTGSKFNQPRYKTRSKVFKPKTRAAVRKSQASAAGALFASADIVTIEAQDNSNDRQRASADVKKELMNYRLERTNGRDSIPWFLVAMGAHQDAQIAGICVSKQYWKYRESPRTGKILADRPDILNIAPECVIIDPNCEWTRPAQSSPYLIVRYPMVIHDVQAMMRPSALAGPAWFEVSEDKLLTLSGMAPSDIQSTRAARSGGADGSETAKTTGAFRVIWIYENFLNIDGDDFTWWSVGNQELLSLPQLTAEAHPALFGERPITIGLGALETHRPIPMSPVESWQQLQQEANDVTNLRLDQMKQVVTPITKVKRGRQVDMDAVMRRGQDTVVMVTDKDDVEWDRPPDVPPSAMAEGNILNNDFDELAGTFSQSSIQSNRSLNETVGGMNLLNSAANSVTEFDLRVWIETWVEPTLWQVVKLEEYYESDEKILAIAGQRAELVEKYGIDAITDHLLMEDITLRVSAGIGAAAPEQRLGKFSTAADIVGKILLPFIENGSVKARPKADAIVEEVFGIAGYKGAGSRFFDIADPNAPQQPEAAPPPDPAEMAKLQLEAKKHSDTMALKGAELQAKSATTIATIQDKQQERAAKVALQHLKSETELQRQRMDELGQRDRLFTEHAHQARENHVGHALEALMAARAARDAAMEREHSAEQADADRAHQAEQAQAAAKAKAAEPKKAA